MITYCVLQNLVSVKSPKRQNKKTEETKKELRIPCRCKNKDSVSFKSSFFRANLTE